MSLSLALTKELENLKIYDIYLYDAENKSILADYFVVSTADSLVQMEAARNKLVEMMKKHRIALKNPQEEWHGGWCLLDFGNIVANILLKELRSFYDLDNLFAQSGFTLSCTIP